MNDNIDLTKILKDCPIGWKFYSSIYGNVKFLGIKDNGNYQIIFIYYGKNKGQEYGGVTKQGLYDTNYYGECILFPSKNQRDWSKFTAPWYKKEKFDPKTLKPFDKVLMRDFPWEKWNCQFFSYISNNNHPYAAVYGLYKMCIPYNDETKHLVGTNEEAPKYYRYWKE